VLVRVCRVVEDHFLEARDKSLLEELHDLALALLWVELHELHRELIDVCAVSRHRDHFSARLQLVEKGLRQKRWLFDIDDVAPLQSHTKPGWNIDSLVLGQHRIGSLGSRLFLNCSGHHSVIELVQVSQTASVLQESARDELLFSQNVVNVPIVALETIIAGGLPEHCPQSCRRFRILHRYFYCCCCLSTF